MNFEELRSYQPPFYRENTEMSAVLKAQGVGFDRLKTDLQLVEDNRFLISLGLDGIRNWESFLNIEPNGEQSLSNRRGLIISTKNGIDKLSASSIKEIAQTFLGAVVDVSFADSNITITFVSRLEDSNSPDTLSFINLINNRVPSHLGIILKNDNISVSQLGELTIQELDEVVMSIFEPFPI